MAATFIFYKIVMINKDLKFRISERAENKREKREKRVKK